jgi:formate-dependent nitrite reductase cytochrome c552 subunit
MQYVAQGNIQADLLKVMVENDPGFSAKTRSKMKASLEGLETSQLATKDQQIQQLQQVITELQSYMKFSQQVIKHQQVKQKATEQAAAEQTKVAAEMIKAKDQEQAAQPQMSESEVKSNNAKGISGSSFSKGGSETIYNTGS